jgi:hypothetical protein
MDARTPSRIAAVSVAALSITAGSAGYAVAATAHAGHTTKGAKAEATHLTLKATKNPTAGDHYKATVVGHLRAHHAPVAGENVALFERKGSGKSWTDTGQSATTDSDGAASFGFVQSTVNEQYQLRFAGDSAASPALKASRSGAISIHRAKQ